MQWCCHIKSALESDEVLGKILTESPSIKCFRLINQVPSIYAGRADCRALPMNRGNVTREQQTPAETTNNQINWNERQLKRCCWQKFEGNDRWQHWGIIGVGTITTKI